MTHDLKKYKDAIAILPHIAMIIKIFELSEKSLRYYKHFVPVARVLTVLKEQKDIMLLNREMYMKIKDSKGLKKNNY